MSGGNPFRVAIVGAGPAGLYSAGQLLDTLELDVEIDIWERLPVPWGLVRGAVAPDHPDKKMIIDRQFAYFLKDRRVRFLGNVWIGRDVTADELASWYDAVVYASGADDDVRMGIAGEDLPGSHAARDFVGYYSGHTDYSGLRFDLGGERAVIVGNGNVALDVARMLTMPVAELERTDIADHALDALRGSAIREVVILARRGAAQAAFNNPELEELEHLSGVDVSVAGNISDDPSFVRPAPDWITERKLTTLKRLNARPRNPAHKQIRFHFMASPLALQGGDRVEQLVAVRNQLRATADGAFAAEPTEDLIRIDTGLVLRAIGYRGRAFPGLPFDERKGVIANRAGRVMDGNDVVPGVYVAGWIKRGCRGIIGSNRKCAAETLEGLFADKLAGMLRPGTLGKTEVLQVLRQRGVDVVRYRDWAAIDHAERSAGRTLQRPRVKLTDRASMLECASAAREIVSV